MPSPSETVLVHFYRGEMSRSDTWRTRLDNTTNWALTTAAAVASFAFASPEGSHAILILGCFLIYTFLLVEARRYRYYDLWARRVRLLEDGFIAAHLRGEPADPDALRELADLVTRPRLDISVWDALGMRLRRTYAPILLVLGVAWVVKLGLHPVPVADMTDLVLRAHLGPIPGALVLSAACVLAAATIGVYLRSFLRPLPPGELRPKRPVTRPLAMIFRRS